MCTSASAIPTKVISVAAVEKHRVDDVNDGDVTIVPQRLDVITCVCTGIVVDKLGPLDHQKPTIASKQTAAAIPIMPTARRPVISKRAIFQRQGSVAQHAGSKIELNNVLCV